MSMMRTSLPRGLRRLLTAVLAGLLSATLVSAPSASAAGPRDTVTVSGYHYYSERPADVVAGTSGNNLVFRYVAASPLTDGTLVIEMPVAEWSTPLQALGVLTGDPGEEGGVVVRPAPPFTVGPGDCTGTPTAELTWTVVNTATVRRIVVEHLTCPPGQQIAVRIYGIEAPSDAGHYEFDVRISDAAGSHRVTTPRLRVVKPPRTQLEVTLPAAPQAGALIPVTIRALKPNGRVDTSYRGSVALFTVDRHDCSFSSEQVIHDFTAADAGVLVITVKFDIGISHRLVAYDVANQALPGESNPYNVVGDVGRIDCPVSYH